MSDTVLRHVSYMVLATSACCDYRERLPRNPRTQASFSSCDLHGLDVAVGRWLLVSHGCCLRQRHSYNRLEYRWTLTVVPAYPQLSAGLLIGLSLALSCSGWVGIGWILKRLYQPHEKAMVLAFSATVLAALALTILTLSRNTAAMAHPIWLIGLGGNMAGVICTLMGAGFFQSLSGNQYRGNNSR